MTLWAKRSLFVAMLLLLPIMAHAQTAPSQPATSDQQLLKPEELDALVAPIALYPDTLLSLVLMASTYPLEVVQAERWTEANKKLKGDELKSAVDKQAWDDSVKSLVATPSILQMMNSKLDWTQKLGDAVLAQQPDVMDAIQRLRAKAQANKKLESNKQQNVTTRQVENKQVIAIEQTDPNTVYVPYYDPAVVYGAWPYPTYPPYYFPAPGYIAGGLLATGLAFGAGYILGNWGGNYWNGSVNWNNNNITVNRPGNRPDNRPAAATIGSTGPSIAKASDTAMPTSGRSSVTTIFAREAGTGWTSAAAAANKCSSREAASNLERGNGLRVDDPVQGKDLRVDGRAQGNSLRADGRAQGNGLRADGPVQGNDLPVRGAGLRRQCPREH